jgi:hypothetical protein
MAEIKVITKYEPLDLQTMDIVHADYFSDGSARLLFDCLEYGQNLYSKIVQIQVTLYPHEVQKIIDGTKAGKLNENGYTVTHRLTNL